jgi:hypothetical protein
VDELRRLIDQHLGWYSKLAADAIRAGDLLWTLAPKHQWLWHLGHEAQFLHPRRSSCLQDEDFMGRIKHIVCSSTSGTALHQVPLTVIRKYRWGMHFQYVKASGDS